LNVGFDSNVLVASVKKLGEPYHDSAIELARRVSRADVSSLASALVLIEVPGALVSTKMPIEKIYQVAISLQVNFNLKIMELEAYVDRARDLMFEFRELKAKWQIGSADFHHVATSIQEGCDFFVTTDKKHLLRSECRKHFEKHIRVVNPDEALEAL